MAGSFLDAFAWYFGKVGTLAFFGWYLIKNLFADAVPSWIFDHAFLFSWSVVFVIMTFDQVIIYPNLRSPLRNLPNPNDKESGAGFRILTELPRGKTPLTWFKRFPDADIINSKGPLGTSRLFPASPAALRDVLSTYSYDFEKPWAPRAFLARVIGFGLVLSEGATHKHQRKALTPAFNIRNIRALYPFMWQKTQMFLDQLALENRRQGYIELTGWASKLTLDIIGPAALSRDFRTMASENEELSTAFHEILEPTGPLLVYFAINFALPQWIASHLPIEANRMLKKNCNYLRDVCRNILREKHATILSSKRDGRGKPTAEEETDILYNIITCGEFNDEDIVDQMLTFLAAGHETTASALTWCSYLLTQNPAIQAKLREEIRTAIPSPESPVTSELLESLPYLNGVCEETFRLFPTVPMTVRESQRTTTIAGQTIPKDTLIIISPYAVNRHPAFWGPDAEEMKPERWIDTDANGAQRPNKHGGASSNFCQITFLHGARACIGRDFAKAELRCAVAAMFARFDVSMVDPNEEVVIGGTVTTKPRGGMRLKLNAIDGW